MTVIIAVIAGAGHAHAATATNTLPRESWRARGPDNDLPPSSPSLTLGFYASPGEAFLAMDAYATSKGPPRDPKQRKFSTGLIAPQPDEISNFDSDVDDNGETDAYLYSEPLGEFANFPHNCSNGDGARFPTGGVYSRTSGLVYEPAEEPASTIGPMLKALCERVYCAPVSGCTKQGNYNAFFRRAAVTFVAEYDPANGVCDNDRRLVFEDLVGNPSSSQSCELVGGLNDGANLGGDCPALENGSNPVNTVTGNKYQRETDYAGTVHGELRFERYYNSLLKAHQDIGLGWRHTYSANLTVTTSRTGGQSARLIRPDGRVLVFNRLAGSTQFTSDPLTVGNFAQLPGNNVFEFVDGDDVRERYEYAVSARVSRGTIVHLLLASRYDPRSGRRETLTYDAHRTLATVVGRFGRSLSFGHDALGRLREMTDPAGRRYTYDYDRLGRLVSVTYPDLDDSVTDAASRANNPLRAYRYDDPDWPKGLTDIVDESGSVYAHWDYDTRGRALTSEHAGGAQRVVFDYQSAYTAITDAIGQTRSYNTQIEYGVGLIAAVTGGNCNFCGAGPLASTTYDSNGRRNLITDHAGNVTDFDYDASGLELRKSEGSGNERRVTSTTWLSDYRLPSTQTIADGAGQLLRRTTNDYWGGMLKRRTEEDLLAGGANRITGYTYFGEDDASDPRYGLLKSVDGPRDDVLDVTRYDYDAATGNLLSVTNALGHVTRYTAHDADGRVLTEVDPNGVETRYVHDARGRLLSRNVAGAETRMQYDARGLLLVATFPDQSTQRYSYDQAQRLVRIEDSSGNAIEYSLDALGNRTEERHLNKAGAVVGSLSRIYNRHNQLEQSIGGAGQTTGYVYDANGRLQSVTDPRGGGLASTREYDSLGRDSAYIDNLGGVTRVSYDHNDQPLTATDPRGLITRYHRDGFGNLLRTDSPDAGSSHDEYDAAGNRIRHSYQQKPGTDIAIGYQFDALNRLRTVDYPRDTDVVYNYDEGPVGRHGLGRLTSMRDASGLTSFSYDARGNVRQRELEGSDGTYAVLYEYDLADRVAKIRYPSGMLLTVLRDAAGRVTRLSANVGATSIPIVDGILHHTLGGVARMRFGNGLIESRSYDGAGRLATITVSDPRLPSYRYPLYDAADNLLRAEGGFVDKGLLKPDIRNFRYDANDRLMFEDSSLLAIARRYVYDANGNRMDYQMTSTSGALLRRDQFTVETQSNRIHGANARPDDYDAAGNMTRYVVAMNNDPLSAAIAQMNYRIVYNEAGRLARTSLGTTMGIMESFYNGFGERAKSVELLDHRRSVTQLNDESGKLLSAIALTPGGTPSYREYIWLDGRPVAEIVSAPGRTARVNYIHVNQINQPLYMTGMSGAATWTWKLGDAFGLGAIADKDPDGDGIEEIPAIGGVFPGQVMGTPFISNGFRDYEPRSGRYVESDPIGIAGGINTYTYVGGNPLRFNDPEGLTQCDVDIALELAERRLAGRKLPSPAKGRWRPPGNVEIVANDQIDRLGRHGQTGESPSAASRRWGDEWIDTLLNPRYGECLSDDGARDLFDTILHEGAHWGAPANASYQYDSNSSAGFAYSAAKEFGTPNIVSEYIRARQKCRCICGK